MIKIAQMDRAVDVNHSTRFSYVDLIIKNLLSEATTKKFSVFSLVVFWNTLYCSNLCTNFLLYLCDAFIASMYIANLVKLIFVLSLGPIFMVFSLFTRTQQMFKIG